MPRMPFSIKIKRLLPGANCICVGGMEEIKYSDNFFDGLAGLTGKIKRSVS